MAFKYQQNASLAVKTGADPSYTFIGVNQSANMKFNAEEKKRTQLSPVQGDLASRQRKIHWTGTFATEGKGGGLSELGLLELPESDSLFRGCGFIRERGYTIKLKNITGGTPAYGQTVMNGSTNIGKIYDLWTIGGASYIRVMAAVLPVAPINNDELTIGAVTADVDGVPDELIGYYRTSVYALQEKMDMRFVEDTGLKHCVNARADMKYSTDGISALEFTVTGEYESDPTDTAPIIPEISEIIPAITDGSVAMIGDFIFDEESEYPLQSFDFSVGNKIGVIPAQNKQFGIGGLSNSASEPAGNISFVAPSYGEFNPYTAVRTSAIFRISHQFGITKGNRLALVIPNAQLGVVDDSGAVEGTVTYKAPFMARRHPSNKVPSFVLYVF